MTVKSLNLPVTVPAGTFSCTETEAKNLRTGETTWVYSTKTDYIIRMKMQYSGQDILYDLRKKNF